jgi:hypothetical protein
MTEINQSWINSQQWTKSVEEALYVTCQRDWFCYSIWLNISENDIITGMKGMDNDRAAWASFVNICQQRRYTFKDLVDVMLKAKDQHIVVALQKRFLEDAAAPLAPPAPPAPRVTQVTPVTPITTTTQAPQLL